MGSRRHPDRDIDADIDEHRHRRRHPGDARRARQGVHGHGRQLRDGHTGYRGHRGRVAQLLADGSGVDQTEPQSCRTRRHGIDPAEPGRTDRDIQNGGKQQVSVEDSMSMVHRSRGSLHPPSDQVRSEVAIVCQLARTLLGPGHPVPWEQFNDDYDTIRDAIAAVAPGCDDYNRKVRQPDGFHLPHPPRASREFPTSTGKADFSINELEWVPVPPGRLVLQTLRSHDQYNTTIYGLDDRYRGVKGGRRAVFVNPADVEAFGLSDGDRVDLVSETQTGMASCRSAAPRTSWWWRTPPREVMPRPTIPRRIHWWRWTTWRRNRIRRFRRRS